MWTNLFEALVAGLAFVVLPFLLIAALAGGFELCARFFHFLTIHVHQPWHRGH